MITVTSVEAQNRFGQLFDKAQREPIVIRAMGDPQRKAQRDWARASAEAWNEFDSKFGSFADEHSTL